jgi:DNA-directed RNA polymerase specialized sigma24 family protein
LAPTTREDVAQEAFARLYRRQAALRDPDAALSYVRAIVCNLTRNRARHLSVARRWLSAAQEAAGQAASYEEPALAGEGARHDGDRRRDPRQARAAGSEHEVHAGR